LAVETLVKLVGTSSGSGANLINIQRLGLRLRLKKASSGMDSGLRLTVIFDSQVRGFLKGLSLYKGLS